MDISANFQVWVIHLRYKLTTKEDLIMYQPFEENNAQFPAPEVTPPAPVPPDKPKKSFGFGKLIALALVCSLLGGIVGAVGYHFLAPDTEKGSAISKPDNVSQVLMGQRENTAVQIHSVPSATLMTPAEVYAANVRSTVGITTSVTTNFWGYQTTSAASGSGFIFTDDGYILTNYHVIEDSDSITVSMYDGESYAADLIGYDSSNDIAILKIDAQGLAPVILGDSNKMNVGDSVVAIGNPLGELTFSLTAGTVSALNREVTMQSGGTMNLIQTDCAINSGNSGGALFNLYGEVIGITNAKYSSSGSGASIDNIAFAIPVSNVWNIVESILEKGYIAKPYIGISVADLSKESQLYGLPQGAAVHSISKDSPAEAAGLQMGDIITAVDGTAVTSSSELVALIGQAKIGQVLELSVYRKGQTLTVSVSVGEQIQEALPQQEAPARQPFQGFGW